MTRKQIADEVGCGGVTVYQTLKQRKPMEL